MLGWHQFLTLNKNSSLIEVQTNATPVVQVQDMLPWTTGQEQTHTLILLFLLIINIK